VNEWYRNRTQAELPKLIKEIEPMTRAFALVFVLLIPLVAARAQTPQGEIISLDDEYNLTLPASPEDLRIVQRAKQILNRPEKWDRSDTRVCHVKACNLGCPTLAQTFSLYCALKRATEEVTRRFEHRGRVMQEARFVIDEIAVNRKDFEHRLQGYNNSPERTFDDIQKVLLLLEDRIRKRLAEQPRPTR
jgi:uncharacterized protein YkuJ